METGAEFFHPFSSLVEPIDNSEWSGAQHRLKWRVVTKLSPWKPLEPVSRTITRQVAKIHGNDLIRRLWLTIRLRVEHRRHVELHSWQLEQLPPEIACENRVPITYYRAWDAMKSYDVREENSCNWCSSVWMTQCDEVGWFGEQQFNNCKDHRFAIHPWQSLKSIAISAQTEVGVRQLENHNWELENWFSDGSVETGCL